MRGLKKVAALATMTAALLLPATGAGAASAHDREDAPDATSTVAVVHGVPGADLGLDPALPVDVLVNGSICALIDLQFGQVAPRLELPAGTYDLEVKLSDGACGGATAIEADDVELPGGVDATVVAHLDADGAPTLSVFIDDLSETPLYQARVAVHHTAAAPAVDVTLTYETDHGRWTFPFVELNGVTNGQQGVAETWVGDYAAEIRPAGGDESSAVFSAPLTLESDSYYAVYAVGSLSTGTFTVIVDREPTAGASH